jgi:hypothetical protein
MPSRRSAVWSIGGILGATVVALVLTDTPAYAYNVFCAGDSWPTGTGSTMEQADFPSVLPSDVRASWPEGLPGGDSVAMNVVDSNSVVYQEYPDLTQKFLCAGTSAAPCVISSTVTHTFETWQAQHWKVGAEIDGGYMYAKVKVSAEYGREWGSRDSKTVSVTNMAPYKLGDTIQPAHFIEWRNRAGQVKGGYFNTGAVCRTRDGESGEQYEWRDDPTGITFDFDRNIGEGEVWMKEGEKTSWDAPYNGQDGWPPNIPRS